MMDGQRFGDQKSSRTTTTGGMYYSILLFISQDRIGGRFDRMEGIAISILRLLVTISSGFV